MKKAALFGGSFNPPHIGHQMMLVYLINVYDFDEIWINPVKKHYFEKDRYLISSELRLKMTKIAFEKLSDKIKIKPIDIENNFSKTYDTVNYLKKEYYDIDFTLVLGEDNYNSRKKWFKFSEIEKLVDIIYLGRKGIISDLTLPFKFPDISSSNIRKNIKENRLLIDRDVYGFIKKNKLYSFKS